VQVEPARVLQSRQAKPEQWGRWAQLQLFAPASEPEALASALKQQRTESKLARLIFER
jgi:hypothetical protein